MGLHDQLASVPLLSGVPDKVRRRLSEIGKRLQYAPEDVVVREGEGGIAFYIILSGSVRVEQGGTPIATLGAGEFFGELALIEEHARTATVVAAEPTELLGFTRWEFIALLDENPQVAVPMMHVLIRRLHKREHHPS